MADNLSQKSLKMSTVHQYTRVFGTVVHNTHGEYARA